MGSHRGPSPGTVTFPAGTELLQGVGLCWRPAQRGPGDFLLSSGELVSVQTQTLGLVSHWLSLGCSGSCERHDYSEKNTPSKLLVPGGCWQGQKGLTRDPNGPFLPRDPGWDKFAPWGPCPPAYSAGDASPLCKRWPRSTHRQLPER